MRYISPDSRGVMSKLTQIILDWQISFRTRLALIAGGVAFLTVIGLSLIAHEITGRGAVRNHGELLRGIAHQLSGQISTSFNERFHELRSAAALDLLQKPQDPHVRRLLEQMKKDEPAYAWIGIVDRAARIQVATGQLQAGRTVDHRPMLSEGLQGPFVGDLQDTLLSRRAPLSRKEIAHEFLDISTPIFDAGGSAIGVLGANLNFAWVSEFQRQTESQFALRGLEVEIIDRDGDILPTSISLAQGIAWKNVGREPPFVQSATQSEGFLLAPESNGNSYLSGFATLEGPLTRRLGWIVVARQTERDALAVPREMARTIFWAGCVGAAMTFLVTWILMGRMTKPVLSIAKAALDAKADGYLRVQLPVYPRSDEIGVLSSAMDELVGRLQSVNSEVVGAKLAAERASLAKSEFLANMSHEIRTPLGAIMGFIDLMKDSSDPEETRAYIATIDRNSKMLLRIIDDILDLSKVEAGKLVIERAEFSLPVLLGEFQDLMAMRAREKAILFSTHALNPLPDLLVGDVVRIRQILTNAVGNAIKFTDSGAVELRVAYDGGFLEFTVADTGRGISAEQARKLFQPFAQADSSTTRQFGGSGLGLVLGSAVRWAVIFSSSKARSASGASSPRGCSSSGRREASCCAPRRSTSPSPCPSPPRPDGAAWPTPRCCSSRTRSTTRP